ncbi:MAG: DUF2179 domain-containing protein [Actinobacteria bacterium]|nr:MAG: DUF2179 domain-containing protein [Actinomycetota bacterium]
MELVFDLVLIFTLRLLDVGMSTVRIVLLGKGRKGTATGLGFVEALIWVIAVARVLDGLDDPLRMIAFAGGFAAGTYFGALVEEWIAIGQAMVRVVAPVESNPVAPLLREKDFGATEINGSGLDGDVRITFCVIPRKRLGEVTHLIREANPAAYVTVDSTTSIDLHRRAERLVRR